MDGCCVFAVRILKYVVIYSVLHFFVFNVHLKKNIQSQLMIMIFEHTTKMLAYLRFMKPMYNV